MEVIRNHMFKFLPVVLAFSFCLSVADTEQSSLCYIKKKVTTQSLVCREGVSIGNCCQQEQLLIQNVTVHRRPACNSTEKCSSGARCCDNGTTARTLNYTDRTAIEAVFKTSGCFKETNDVPSDLPYNTGLEVVVITYTCHNVSPPVIHTTTSTTGTSGGQFSATGDSDSKVIIVVVVPIVAVIVVVTTVVAVVLIVRRRRTASTREDNHLSINHIHNNVLSYQTPPTVTDTNDFPSYSVVDKIHVNCEPAQTESDNYTRIYNTINLQHLPVIKNPTYGHGPDRIDSNDPYYYDHVGEWARSQVSGSDTYAHIGCPNIGSGGGPADSNSDKYSHTSGTGTQDDNGAGSQFV